jgi:hypothetical protein
MVALVTILDLIMAVAVAEVVVVSAGTDLLLLVVMEGQEHLIPFPALP